MSLRTEEVAAWLVQVEREEWKDAPAGVIVMAMLMQSLGPLERSIYTLVVEHPGSTSVDIGARLDLHLNNVGNILGKLRSYGLVRSKTDRHFTGGILYEWEAAS